MKQQTPGAAGSESLKPWMVMTALAMIVLAIYHPVTGFGFVDMDDDAYFTKNAMVKSGLTMAGVKWAFTTFAAANWHPLTWLSLMADASLFGTNGSGPHTTNLILHAINSILVFTVIWRMTGGFWRSSLVAALFAAHPIHVESVAWVSERKDVLSTFFGLLALISYHRFVVAPGAMRYTIVAVFYVLSLMAKPMLVTLPFILLLLDFWPLRRIQPDEDGRMRFNVLGRLALEKMPLLCLAVASSIVTVYAQKAGGAVQTLEAIGIGERLQNVVVAYASYVGKAVAPVDLCVYYPLPNNGIPGGKLLLSAFLLIGVTYLAVRSWRRRPYLTMGWAWFLGTLIPVIGLVHVGSQAMADRYGYIPFLGLYIMLAWGAAELATKAQVLRSVIGGAMAFVVLLFGIMASRQARLWSDSESLFRQALLVTTNNALIEADYGMVIGRKGRHDEAIHHLNRALLLYPDFFDAHYNLGVALDAKGRLEEAVEHYAKALKLQPESPEVNLNMGTTLGKLGRREEALVHLEKVIAIDPDNAEANTNIGMIYLHQRRIKEAVERLESAVEADPRRAESHNNLGLALEVSGQTGRAIHHYKQAIRFKPDFMVARRNLHRAEMFLANPELAPTDSLPAP